MTTLPWSPVLRRLGASLPVLAALSVAAAPGAQAQVVRGQVVEDGTATPLQGAMVILLDAGGGVVGRVLTDAGGAFVVRAGGPGVHRIRVDRIGYESLVTPAFDVPPEGVARLVAVPVRAVELAGLEVEASRRCTLRADLGPATARVWEEARKALEAAAWTLSSGAYRYTLMHLMRTLEADARTVVREDRRFARGAAVTPYVSLPAAELVEGGFIRRNADGSYSYYAPDAEALLSDAFLDTHCMSLGSGRDGMVSLDFQPVRERRLPDIRGTLWLDASTSALHRLEFTYVNVPAARNAGAATGEVVFAHLPDGTWIVREWSIRTPLIAIAADASRMMVTGYQVDGGVVWRVADRTGRTVLEAATAAVSGVVVDSLGAPPRPAATVRVAGADEEGEATAALTGADGSFLLSGLPPGLVELEVHHPLLDSLRLGSVGARVEAEAGSVGAVRIRLPGIREAMEQTCADAPPPERGTAMVLARVLRGAAPAAGHAVRVRWLGEAWRGFETARRAAPAAQGAPELEWREDPSDPRWITTTMDERGVFVFCHVPTPSQVRVEVSGDDGTAARTFTLADGPSVLILTFALPESRAP